MNQMNGRSAHKLPRMLVMTAFATAMTLASSAAVFASAPVQKAAVAGAHALPQAQPPKKHKKHHAVEETTEDRIVYLHKVLQITPAQEDQWSKVAAVMRDNGEKITVLAKARAENYQNMNAVDDLRSYADFSSAHEDGTRKLIPVFQSLYEDMSTPQKQVADMVFHERGRKGRMGAKS